MIDGSEKITVQKTHTDEMIRDELLAMIGVGRVHLTIGSLAALASLDSPYIRGGSVSEDQLDKAYSVVSHGELDRMAFHEELQRELDTAFRVFETILPDPKRSSEKGSEIATFSPEWFADMISQACQSMPSLTYRQLMDEIPLAMVFHLAVSSFRRNGATTGRPNDVGEALRQFKTMREGGK